MAIAAALCLLVCQCLDPGFELVNRLSLFGNQLFVFVNRPLLLLDDGEKGTDQLCHQRNHAIFALHVSGVYLFTGRKLQGDHVDIVPGLYDFGKSKSNQVWLSSYAMSTS